MTIDAHKWFATTMGCGMFVTRWPALLSSAFGTSASYMPSNIPDVDPYITSVQWSRRFAGLRLFLSLAAAGWEGYGKHIEHALSLVDLLKEQLIERGWTVANSSPAGVLCIVPPEPKAVRQIVNQMVTSGSAWVSVAVLEGHEVIRACVTSGMTTAQDIFDLVAALERAAVDCSLALESTDG